MYLYDPYNAKSAQSCDNTHCGFAIYYWIITMCISLKECNLENNMFSPNIVPECVSYVAAHHSLCTYGTL